MNNTEKILEHLAQSGKPDDKKRDKRAVMDAKTAALIKQQELRLAAWKEQADVFNRQVAALEELLRQKTAEAEIYKTAFTKAGDIIEKK